MQDATRFMVNTRLPRQAVGVNAAVSILKKDLWKRNEKKEKLSNSSLITLTRDLGIFIYLVGNLVDRTVK